MAGDLRTNRNELIVTFEAAWKAAQAAVPYHVPGEWPYVLTMTDADGVPKNPKNLPWSRLTIQHTGSVSRGIAGRRVVHSGLVIVQVMVPNARTTAPNQAQQIAGLLGRAFIQHRGNVALFDFGPVERPINNGFAQCDCAGSFTWDEFVKRSGA